MEHVYDILFILFLAGFLLFPILWIGINGDRMVFHQGEPKGIIYANGSAEESANCGEEEGRLIARQAIEDMKRDGTW